MINNQRFLVFIIAASVAVWLHFPVQSQSVNPLDLALEAQQLYQQGQVAPAANTWKQAAIAYQEQGDRLGSSKSWINQAQALQDLGLYSKACNALLTAFDVQNADCQDPQISQLIQQLETRNKLTLIQGIGLRSLGDILRRKGNFKQSRQVLQLSQLAVDDSEELGATWLALGNVERAIANQQRNSWNYDQVTEIIDRQEPNLALEPYLDTFVAYESAAAEAKADPLVRVQAKLNYLDLLIEIEDWWQTQIKRRVETWDRGDRTNLINAADEFGDSLKLQLDDTRDSVINAIEDTWSQILPSHQGIYAKINYTRSLNRLGQQDKIEPILTTALTQARAIADRIGESYVLGYLGEYYGQQGQTKTAIAYTNQALITAQGQNVANDVREVTYLWQSQLGQLLEATNQLPEAISAYTSAYQTLQSLRTDLNANNQVVQFDFRQEVKPVYLRLANLLLQSDRLQASKSWQLVATGNNGNRNLELARQVIESLQLAELDNFFQDPCSQTAEETITIDQIDPQAAVIYPIILRDRLEVILSVAGQPLQQFTTLVPEATVNRTINLLYDNLYNQSVDESAVNIFSTTPVDPEEIKQNMQTLLPILQQIHSWLIEPLAADLTNAGVKTLVFVLNGQLQNVPLAALYDGKQYLLEKYGVALAPSLQLLDLETMPREQIKVLAAGLSQQVEIKGNIFPSLVNVPQELKQIQQVFPESRQLLNGEFTTEKIQQQLQADFSVLHLATHGVFSSDPKETFIVTGDNQIVDLNTLSNLLNSGDRHPELIVLSACDTATGDERAILGLAGVTVRSGSSTIATLWSVEDASTAQLMSQFYQEFANSNTQKVAALQKAQLSLMNSLQNNPTISTLQDLPAHPYYWAPYVLVGNWQ